MSGTPTDQKIGKFVIGALLLALTFGILNYFSDAIMTGVGVIEAMANLAMRLGVYGLITALVFFFIKAQWRNIGYINDYFARKVFSSIITYDPFLIQEKQIMQSALDMEEMMKEKAVIEGKFNELNTKLANYRRQFNEAKGAGEEVAKAMRITTDADEMVQLKLDAQECVDKQTACLGFVNSIQPIANDMEYIIKFVSDGYQIMKRKIKSAKNALSIFKDQFESAHAGAEALDRMKKAMVGDIQLNSDADKANLALIQNIALTIGKMKVSMEIISDVTRSTNLEESGRAAVARKQLEALNLGEGEMMPVSKVTANFQNTVSIKQTQLLPIGAVDLPD
jgi:hypothetical protein